MIIKKDYKISTVVRILVNTMKISFLAMGLFLTTTLAQPVPTQYFSIGQKDSLYYLLTDKALFKFYSHEASGEFFLTNYIEKDFSSSTRLVLNDQHLFLTIGDTIYIYSNSDAWDLTFEGVFVPEYPVTSVRGFGPYFFIRSGNIYKLLKTENGTVTTVEDTLFTQPPNNNYVHLTYPYVVLGCTAYKYVEGFDFYPVQGISGCGTNVNTGLTGNKLVHYFYWYPPEPPLISILYINIIEEPYFPHFEYDNWGINVSQIHTMYGYLITKENLYYFVSINIVLTKDAGVAYIPSESDITNITDYYIFLLGDSLHFSKWYAGSTFYPFTWTDLSSIQETNEQIHSFSLSQNYPNPFNPTTTITYEIPYREQVTLKVFNTLGQEVTTLVDEEKSQGRHKIEFDASGLSSGVYFYVLSTSDFVESKKMILMR